MPRFAKIFFTMVVLGAIIIPINSLWAEETLTPSPTPDTTQITAQDEDVKPEDLEVKEPKVLPGSPFYIFKSMARSVQSAMTRDPVKKAGLKMKFANEKLMEMEKVARQSQNADKITKAAEKYKEEISRIKDQVQNIKEKAQNNTETQKFLDKFIQHQMLHEKVLQKLENQVPEKALEKIKEAREEHLEKFKDVMVKLENVESLPQAIDRALENQKGSQFKEFKNIEILKNLEEKMPETAREAMKKAQENSMMRLRENMGKMDAAGQMKFTDYVDKISGQKEKHLEILDNLKSKIETLPNAANMEQLKQGIEESRIRIMDKAERKIEKINCRSLDNVANSCDAEASSEDQSKEESSTTTPSPKRVCIQVITPAKNPETGACKNFPTPCDVPEKWVKTASCSSDSSSLDETNSTPKPILRQNPLQLLKPQFREVKGTK